MALGLYNTISIEPSGTTVTAPGAADPGLAAMAERMRAACARAWGRALPGFTVQVQGDVPIARGMGSSSTILLGVAAACQQFAGRALDRHELIELTTEVEGHPDNVAAACLGGFTVVGRVGGRLRTARFDPPQGLTAVVTIPPYEVKTSAARAILPTTLTRAEHITGLQRTALIVAALASGDASALHGLFTEAWHESYRAQLNPLLERIRANADNANALGTIISGSGSTLLSFVSAEHANQPWQQILSAGLSTAVVCLVLPLVGTGLTASTD